jgi:hypothetical protein
MNLLPWLNTDDRSSLQYKNLLPELLSIGVEKFIKELK